MRHTKRIVLCLTLTLVAGCGGGGGGGGGDFGGNGSGAPARQQADLKGANASLFAEVFRQFLLNEIGFLDELVAGFGGDMPVLTLRNGQETENCDQGGNAVLTAAGNGADLTLEYQSCVEAGVTANGRLALSFTNVNATAQSYDFRATYTAFSITAGANTATFNGTTTVHTDVINGVHVHRLVIDSTLNDSGTTYTADDLTTTVRHVRDDHDALTITAANGAIGVSGRGFANVAFRAAAIHFTGSAGSELFVTLDGVSYGMRYRDAQGQEREVSIPATASGQLDVLDGVNSAPEIAFVPNVTMNTGVRYALDLRDDIVDPDFERVEVALTVVGGPAGRTLSITTIATGQYEISGADSGAYTVRIDATDALGARAQRQFTVTVNGDFDRDGLLDIVDPDDDNDGVLDLSDALPFDAAESRDADGDGLGDNADPDDDNDGVGDSQDAFPLDPACSSTSAGSGIQCFLSAIRDYDALISVAGVLHFVEMSDKAVYRWDAAAASFAPTWQLDTAVPSSNQMTSAAYVAAHDRFYFGYDSGAITAVSPQLGTEQAFASVPLAVRGLATAGNFLLAQDGSGAWATHYTFAANGSLQWSAEWNRYSRVYTFNPAEKRVYFFRDDTSPNDLHYEEIDQTSGVRTTDGETPYHGAYGIEPPIVVSPAGDLILIGSGNLFNAGSLTWAAAVPGGIEDAYWDAADGLIALRAAGATTALERRDAALGVVEQRSFEGTPRAIARVSQGYVVVTESPQRLFFHTYLPSNDSDSDGVSNTQDAFPLDVAASIDTDHDGHPDSWNGGRSQADSTTGLVLDAYPTESACYLPQHGDGVTCNIESTLSNYSPDAVAGDIDGVAYLLSAENNRVYRYSGPAARHLSPIVVGSDTPVNRTAPTHMEYSPQHERLYLGYASGAITYVDLNEAQLRERPFTNVATAVGGLGAAAEYLAVQDFSGAWATHYYFDEAGTLRDSAEWNYQSRDYEWNDSLRRLFFFRHSQSPTDLHFEDIGLDGTILSQGQSPYHGGYSFLQPIVMSPDGQYVLIGGGEIFRASDLTWYRSLVNDFVAAIWDDNGTITAVEDVGGATRIHRYNASQVWQSEENRAGAPLALLEHAGGYLLVTHDGAKPVFSAVAR